MCKGQGSSSKCLPCQGFQARVRGQEVSESFMAAHQGLFHLWLKSQDLDQGSSHPQHTGHMLSQVGGA